MLSPPRDTATSAWTNSSRNCCSECASAGGGRGGLVHLCLQGAGTRRGNRHGRVVGPGPAPGDDTTTQRAASSGLGGGFSSGLRGGAGGHGLSPRRPLRGRAAARSRRPRPRGRGAPPGQAVERHRVSAGHRRAPGRVRRRARGLGRRLRKRAPASLHRDQAALVAPLRAGDPAPDGRRHAAARLADVPAHRETGHRPGRRLGHRLLVPRRVSLPRRPARRPGRPRGGLGNSAARGALSRAPPPESGCRGERWSARAPGTTWRPPSDSGSGRATWP